MNKMLAYSIMIMSVISANAQPWYADHHKRQTIDAFAASITQHAHAKAQQRTIAQTAAAQKIMALKTTTQKVA